MNSFKVVQVANQNKSTVGDKFVIEGGHVHVVAITNKYVKMNNDLKYPRKIFNKWMRIELKLRKSWKARIYERIMNITKIYDYEDFTEDTRQKIARVSEYMWNVQVRGKEYADKVMLEKYGKEIKEKKFSVYIDPNPEKKRNMHRPVMALRFIIVINSDTKTYNWVFADKTTSHVDLLKEYQENVGELGWMWSAVSGGFYNLVTANAMKSQYHTQAELFLFGKSDSYGMNAKHFQDSINVLRETIPHVDIISNDLNFTSYE